MLPTNRLAKVGRFLYLSGMNNNGVLVVKSIELRIGNLVNYPLIGIRPIRSGADIDSVFEDGGTPIPLTAEWLLKCGFKYDNVCEIYELNGIMLCEYHGEGCRLVELDREGEIVHVGKVFAHVHQLQNIYLDLTGEERTIKETVRVKKSHCQ